jgi:uncharacterized protein (DUF952 family)
MSGLLIYKILLPAEWAQFEAAGRFTGSPFDHSSGFIHCSAREQAAGTALLVFPHEPELVIAALDTGLLGDAVRWELAPAVAAVYRVAGAASVAAALASPPPDN